MNKTLAMISLRQRETLTALLNRIWPANGDGADASSLGLDAAVMDMLAEDAYRNPILYRDPPFSASVDQAQGWQSARPPAAVMLSVLDTLDAFATASRGIAFASLQAPDQDRVLSDFIDGRTAWVEPMLPRVAFRLFRDAVFDRLFVDRGTWRAPGWNWVRGHDEAAEALDFGSEPLS